ncbi:hypothetical protein NDU88_001180 [Pleurodeles waltl]|uniref:C-type lectin domain-containing protein n=1 Tax=Pleurodeles waltl TaxID=8319 RepID=A0AAV7SYS2_PLEWA|nr:hypothetical protein NDU88_001180 [Pleurodeles waltl]KAJ1169287.1 hypothetical protein NDU88_001180 [Pleurodeles waltl]
MEPDLREEPGQETSPRACALLGRGWPEITAAPPSEEEQQVAVAAVEPRPPAEGLPAASRRRRLWRVVAAAVAVVLGSVVLAAVFALRAREDPASEANRTDEGGLSRQCEAGWTLRESSCFLFSENEGSWTFANGSCASRSSSLAVIKSDKERGFALSEKGEYDRWVGLRRDPSGPWRWADGSALDSGTGVPGGSDCAYLNHQGLSSARCSSTRRYICTKHAEYIQKE